MAWTHEELELAKSLWAKGHSGGEIAKTLGRGYTRSAVIGKLNRLLLLKKEGSKGPSLRPSRAKPKQPRVPSAPKPKSKPAKPFIIFKKRNTQYPERVYDPGPIDVPPSLKLTLMERRDFQCAYITDEPHLYCGHPVKAGKRYCEGHYKIMYLPPVRIL